MTTQRFDRPGEPETPPATGGGKIAVDPPINAPIPPQRSVWAIVFPIALIVGVLGFIIAMYVSGMRSFGTYGLFGGFMAFGLVGTLIRGRGASNKLSHSELTQYRRKYFADLDDKRDQIEEQRRKQWEHRTHFHWEPRRLTGVAGSNRMWERKASDDEFAVVRVGVGKVALAMQIETPKVQETASMEPATGHALRKFLIEQQYIDDMPKTIWLRRFPGLSLVGELDDVRAVARAMICQLAAFHSPSDVQIMVVSAAPSKWDWAKWLPHMQHGTQRDGCGERRLLFSSAAKLEVFLDEAEQPRAEWSPPPSGPHGGQGFGALPLRVIIDDHCGTPEDWAGLTGKNGYDGTCFIRLAPAVPVAPASAGTFSARTWVGFGEATTYRLSGAELRKRVPHDEPALFNAARRPGDELDDAFYATADQMSVLEAQRFARALARWRAPGVEMVAQTEEAQRTLFDALGVTDPERMDLDRMWAPRRTQGRDWGRFPVGLDPSGQVVDFDLKEGSQRGMGMHSLFVGTTGAGKSEGIITEVSALALTHSPEVFNVVFTDFKLKSAGTTLERFPHVVASVSNLADERDLVGRMYEALDGELNERGALCARLNLPDLTSYNERRLTDPSLPPIPALWIICDEYPELLGDEQWGPRYQDLFDRIMRLGRAYHMFLQLVGQTVDVQKLRKVRKLLGFTIAARTGREEDSREAIGSKVAAHLPEAGVEGTAYLRVALGQPREYRFFFSSALYTPKMREAAEAQSRRAGTWFAPRTFTAVEATDADGLLATPVQTAQQPALVAPEPVVRPRKLVDIVIEKTQATGVVPPRLLWLPPLGDPPTIDDLVGQLRGRPWDVDYGNNDGLVMPVALADRPREHRQDVHCLDLLNDNALIVCAPKRGATNAVMTLITGGALMYRPDRVQFYCIAASGPQLAEVASLPHVAAVAPLLDREGVNRLIGTVQGIVTERERIFAQEGISMERVRRVKFGSATPRENLSPEEAAKDAAAARVTGGDVVVVVDGWANFTEAMGQHADVIVSLMRARNYGVRVVITHTSWMSGLRIALKNEAHQRLEMVLTDWQETTVPRIGSRQPAREVPDKPGRGVTAEGHHFMVGVPELDHAEGRVSASDVGAVVAKVAGVDRAARVLRLPERVPLEDVLARVDGSQPRYMVPFGLSESTLDPAFVDFAEHPHVVAVGQGQSGRTAFVRAMCKAIMARYSPEEATIALFDPKRRSIGVVPNEWLTVYAYSQSDIEEAVKLLAGVFAKRQPPPGASQEDMLTRQFWTGRKFFVVIDDMTSWPLSSSPFWPLADHVETGSEIGLHVIATADIRNWTQQSMGQGALGRIVGSLAPVLILDGRRQHGVIAHDLHAEPQRPGKGIYATGSRSEGVLVGWSEPPVVARRNL